MSDLKLFYAPGACSLAAHIALEETGHPFVPVRVDTKGGEHQQPAYLRINPKARVPTLAVDDWVLTESPAILQFIARSFPDAALWPNHPRDQARAAEWLAWIASTVHVAYAHVRRAERYATSEAALQDVRDTGRAASVALWQDVEASLGTGSWAIGEQYTVVDSYLLVFWRWGAGPVLGFDIDRFPRWTAHAQRVLQRPAVQRALEREQTRDPAAPTVAS